MKLSRSLFILIPAVAFAVPPVSTTDSPPSVDATDAANRATGPAGTKISLWAAEPLLANPVSFTFDEQGRAYVAETTRFGHGVPDTRSHMHWLDDDIGSRSVNDRLEMYKRHKYGEYSKYDDQVRRVWDSSGKGVADKSTIFASGFNKPEDGLMSGILARKGDVYLTNIPGLYKLNDADGDGISDKKDTLSTGYGVRVQYLGHDLHGLRMGPDGRLYFSIGDRGLNVINKEGKHLFNPDSGAVLRCEPDGRNLEIVHIGLRNPQELAFDDYGNLFTYDNNCDSGDKARWVQIVPGGDSGWRCGYQYGTLYHTPAVKEGNRGPWNTEKLWHTQHEGQPAYVLPPLAHFGNGPAGITHYPGLGLNDKYKDHFFACDFTSNAGSSIIWSLAVKPKGASFEVVDLHPFMKNMVPTDCEFGPDSNFYWSDWISGWSPQNKGRIFKLTDPEAQKNPKVAETKELLTKGFEKMTNADLLILLEHPHQQVRQEAQFELAGRAKRSVSCVPELPDYLKNSKSPLGRRHALWAVGAILRRLGGEPQLVIELLKDGDPVVRAEAATVLGDCTTHQTLAYDALIARLREHDQTDNRQLTRVCWALSSLGRGMKKPPNAIPTLLSFMQDHAGDPVLYRAGIMAFASLQKDEIQDALHAIGMLSSPDRIANVLAMRRVGGPLAEKFIADTLIDNVKYNRPHVSEEAARAIYDERMLTAMPTLATFTERPKQPDAVAFRALAANFIIGDAACAKRVADFAANKSEPDYLRGTALKLLADWAKPGRRDPIDGLRMDLKERDVNIAKDALKPHLDDIFIGSDAVRKEAVACVSKLQIAEVGPVMANIVKDDKLAAETRVAALFALQALKAKELDGVISIASAGEPKLKAAARVVKAKTNPNAATEFAAALDDENVSVIEKQMMLDTLATMPESQVADTTLMKWLEKLLKGAVPPELKLEVLEACETRNTTKKLKTFVDYKGKLAAYDQQVRKVAGPDYAKRYPESLAGGDAAHGRDVFLNNAAVACQRCHKLEGQGGEVGPPVNGLGKEKSREYLLEAIVMPNTHIAEGYQSVIIETADGKKVSGVLKSKTKEKVTLLTADNKTIIIDAADVESEKPDRTAMPEDIYKKMTRREMRDLVEFLVSLKEKK